MLMRIIFARLMLFDAFDSVAIVDLACFGIAEGLVCVAKLEEFGVLVRVLVGMNLLCTLTVGTLDIALRCGLVDAENLVVVLCCSD